MQTPLNKPLFRQVFRQKQIKERIRCRTERKTGHEVQIDPASKMENQEKIIFKGKVFDVVQKEFEIQGKTLKRDLVIHHGGVSLSCIKNNQILLVEQSRAGVNAKTLEIPAGTLEPGEDPVECGKRELNEETGYEADSLKLITAFYPTPGYDTEVIWVYECDGLQPCSVRRPMDEGEDIEQIWMDLEEAWKEVQEGRIRDGKTIIAIQHAIIQKLNRSDKKHQENKPEMETEISLLPDWDY